MSRLPSLLFLSLLGLSIISLHAATAPAADGPLRQLLQGRSGGDAGDADADNPRAGLSCATLARLMDRLKSRSGKKDDDKPQPDLTAAYGEAPAQSLDIYKSQGKQDGPAPVIVMVHGGAWCIGDKDVGKVTVNKTNRWLPRGFAFVSVNYRMLPDKADPLTQAGDVATALAYVQAHAKDWGGDGDKVILMGHSAGAHLVSLLDADVKLAEKYGAKPWLGTVSLDSAAMDVAEVMNGKHPGFYDDAFGKDKDYWTAASPTEQLTGDSLPWLGVCSSRRADSCPHAHEFAKKAGTLEVPARVQEEDLNHGQINANLGLDGAYTDAVENFMAKLDPVVKQRLGK